MKKTFKLIGLSSALVAGLVLSAGVSIGADDPIKARQGAMKEVGKSFGILKKMAAGETAFDAGAVKENGEKIAKLLTAGKDVFPEGSNGPPDVTRSKDAIWENKAEFLAIFDDGIKAANALAGVSEEAALRPAFGNLGKTACAACHKKFRRPKN